MSDAAPFHSLPSGDLFMRTLVVLFSLFTAISLSSCGTPVVESTVPPASEHHGGVLVPLPENQAYVELLNGKRVKSGKKVETTIVAYMLQADKQTALSPIPTEVVVQLETTKGPSNVLLRSEPEQGDPLGSARFVSKPGDYQLDQGGGEIRVTLDGKQLTAKFRGPR